MPLEDWANRPAKRLMENVVDPLNSRSELNRRSILKAGLALPATAILGNAVLDVASVRAQTASSSIRPFSVNWSESEFETLRSKIKGFRRPLSIPRSGWAYGVDQHYVDYLLDYWANQFDMAAAAKTLNRHDQFIAQVEEIDIHFIRVEAKAGAKKARYPLLLTHGWPGSTFEFWKAIEFLTSPQLNGGGSDIAFDLIIPSLPGHGPSGKPKRPIGARTTARLWDKLMREALGFDKYYAQGGDWGSGVTSWLALDFPTNVQAIHLNLLIAAPQDPPSSQEERNFYAQAVRDEAKWGAYYQLQATEPQSLAYAMVDNPVAQALWLIQRFYQWSDKRNKPFEKVFTTDELLTNVMIYVMNDAFQTSTWFYTGSHEENVKSIPPGMRVEVPTGFASYTGDTRSPPVPRSIVEKGYNLRYWSDIPSGGHFAALEQPQLWARDVKNWAIALGL